MVDTISLLTSLTSWEDIIIKFILVNLNQHQALRLATLNSRIAKYIKAKLYRYIYVYPSEPWSEYKTEEMRKDSLPPFKFHKDINNFKTNKFTIISFQNFKKYMHEMDKKESIYLLEIFWIPEKFEKKIAKHLKHIKYFTVISDGYDAAAETNGKGYKGVQRRTEQHFTAVCGKKNYTRRLEYDDCDYDFHELNEVLLLNLPRNNHVKCLKLTVFNGYRDLELINQVSHLTELYMTFNITHGINPRPFNAKITLPLQKVYIIWTEPNDRIKETSNLYFYIEDVFETQYIQELSLESITTFDNHLKGDLTYSFPKLRQLCLGAYEDIYGFSSQGNLHDFDLLSHHNLQMLIITTWWGQKRYTPANIASLFYNFPQASIHWWYSFLLEKPGYMFDSLAMLSPNLPFAVLGLHWPSDMSKIKQTYSWETKWDVKPGTYTAKLSEGTRSLDVLFKTVYADEELRLLQMCLYE